MRREASNQRKRPVKLPPSTGPLRNNRGLLVAALVLLTIYFLQVTSAYVQRMAKPINYGAFFQLLKDNHSTERVASAVFSDGEVRGTLSDGSRFVVNVPEPDEELLKLLREGVKDFDVKPPRVPLSSIFWSVLPMLLLFGFMWMLFRGAQGGGRILSFGKSRARQLSDDRVKITFEDVAGVDEAKVELQEIIEFLKDPKRFTRLGGKIPKGVLLIGPPGTGKTLLAKAVAGEANVPFFSLSGSDFVEMFVGVGASRVRDLFEQARKSAKASGRGCIIFVDEIDAVGRQRFAGIGGGHDEREQTLNALLVEMDGFNTQEGVILMAATNRPDVLDPALLRPGRFDRQVVIDRPDLIGREAILKVHTRKIPLSKEVNLKSIARQTPGFSGADLANLANEAALLAARNGKDSVGMVELEAAIERVIAGPERKSRVISDQEKKITAYHEAGHALLALLTPGADPLHKVSIIPRGTQALGYTMQLPLQDRYTMTRQELIARLIVLMGGRTSEELVFGEITTGAQNDIEVATDIARRMVCEFGMSERLGTLTFGKRENQIFLGRDLFEERNYSEQTAVVIDEEIRRLIDTCHTTAKQQLSAHREQLEHLARKLLEKEVLDQAEVRRLVGLEEPVASTPAADRPPTPSPASGATA